MSNLEQIRSLSPKERRALSYDELVTLIRNMTSDEIMEVSKLIGYPVFARLCMGELKHKFVLYKCIKDLIYLFFYNNQVRGEFLLEKLKSKDILAINLKYYRYKNNLSQEKFAEMLGSTLPYINQLENGRRKPTLELLDKFASKLNVTSAELITYNKKHHIDAKRIDEKKVN